MKRQIYRIASLMLFAYSLATFSVRGQDVQKYGDEAEGFVINPKMSFRIDVEKTEFVQLEPISMHYSFTNETGSPQTTIRPAVLNDSILSVKSGSKIKQYGELSVFRILLARQPTTFEPGKGVEGQILLEANLEKFFPKPGTYTIWLGITGAKGEMIQSNALEIRIAAPTGIDKEAFDFIQKNKVHQQYPVLFRWKNEEEVEYSKVLLEEFVDKFSASVYGEYAIYQLGNYYFRVGQLDKARVELSKLRNSNNQRIARDAGATLSDVVKSSGSRPRD